MYDRRYPSVFVDEFINPEKMNGDVQTLYPNANKRWSQMEDRFLLTLYNEGKTIKQISLKMGRSQTSIIMRLGSLGVGWTYFRRTPNFIKRAFIPFEVQWKGTQIAFRRPSAKHNPVFWSNLKARWCLSKGKIMPLEWINRITRVNRSNHSSESIKSLEWRFLAPSFQRLSSIGQISLIGVIPEHFCKKIWKL